MIVWIRNIPVNEEDESVPHGIPSFHHVGLYEFCGVPECRGERGGVGWVVNPLKAFCSVQWNLDFSYLTIPAG